MTSKYFYVEFYDISFIEIISMVGNGSHTSSVTLWSHA